MNYIWRKEFKISGPIKQCLSTDIIDLKCVCALGKVKVKVKITLWGFSTLRPFGLLYSYPQQFPAMNFANKSVIHEHSLGSFTCRKAGTWDILFYFLSEGRHTEDFPDARKIQRLRPGLNPRTRVPVASMLTTRPPKPSLYTWKITDT